MAVATRGIRTTLNGDERPMVAGLRRCVQFDVDESATRQRSTVQPLIRRHVRFVTRRDWLLLRRDEPNVAR